MGLFHLQLNAEKWKMSAKKCEFLNIFIKNILIYLYPLTDLSGLKIIISIFLIFNY